MAVQTLHHRALFAVFFRQCFKHCAQRFIAVAVVAEIGIVFHACIQFTQLSKGLIDVRHFGWVFIDGRNIKGRQ
ncbi:hypothetical protein VVS222_01852 [Vibrio vulnificus]|nr:hypothetical protein VVS222_01852 [Vibrio vulnificus]